MKSAVEEQQQAKDVPLMELLRKIPEDYRATIPFQWDENGAETGHHFIPVGKLAHKAAEELDRLRVEREMGVLVPREPSEKMLQAAVKTANGDAVYKVTSNDGLRRMENEAYYTYRAMLAAAEEESK